MRWRRLADADLLYGDKIQATKKAFSTFCQMSTRPHTILIVDDDALLRMHVAERLLDAGYDVIEAENTDAAIRILEQNSNVKLLFTDVQMPPGADGLQLAQIVEDRWPNVLLLVTSGGLNLTDDDVPDGGKFVAKPYRAGELLARVAGLISGNSSG